MADYIAPGEEGHTECAFCGYEHAPVAPFRMHTGRSLDPFQGETFMYCEVCACTPAGNAHAYPDQHRDEVNVLRTIAWTTNRILYPPEH